MKKPRVLSSKQVGQALVSLPGWAMTPGGLQKTFIQPNFRAAVGFVGWVAELAEAADHHPDILVHRYRRVTLTIMTHSAGGVTAKDVDLAGRIQRHGE
jgi:4a-hydroxytetrahydrobiopterin dehydratase